MEKSATVSQQLNLSSSMKPSKSIREIEKNVTYSQNVNQSVLKSSKSLRDLKQVTGRKSLARQVDLQRFSHYSRDNTVVHSAKSDGMPILDRTFKLAPSNYMPQGKVEMIIHEVLKKHLQNIEYNSEECAALTKLVGDEIKQRVKALNLDRYKIIAVVYLGSDASQSINVGSRCVWNTQFDNFASSYFQTNTVFAVGAVYAVYFE